MSLLAPAAQNRAVSLPRRTRAEQLRLLLADEIVNGTLAPGVALDEITLAHRFGVSRTPVREAIRLLSASGLVEVRPHRAAVVAQPTADQLAGMFETMAEFEALCAGFAAERMTTDERRALEDAHQQLRMLIEAGDAQRYHELNEVFHNIIDRGSHNSYLSETTVMTRARVQPFRRAQIRNLGRLAQSHLEHHRIVQAILRGERASAADAMRAHIVQVRDAYNIYSESI